MEFRIANIDRISFKEILNLQHVLDIFTETYLKAAKRQLRSIPSNELRRTLSKRGSREYFINDNSCFLFRPTNSHLKRAIEYKQMQERMTKFKSRTSFFGDS